MSDIDKRDTVGTFMIVSGYTVVASGLKFRDAVKQARGLSWLAPAPVIVKVVCDAKEV